MSGPFRASPPAYLVPEDVGDLQRLVRTASEHGWALIPRGAGTGMPGGNTGSHTVVDLSGTADDIRWIDRGRGLMSVGAATVAAEVDRAARAEGWWLPALPSSARWCTLGGMVANNAAGARSFRYGPIAAFVEVLEGILPDGSHFRTDETPIPGLDALTAELRERVWDAESRRVRGWPRVRKNASGYGLDRYLASEDPAQLLVGSEGTLAIVTRIRLRLERAPRASGLVVLPARSTEALTRIATEADHLPATTCEFLGRRFIDAARLGEDPHVGEMARSADALVLLEVVGAPESVREGIDRIERLGRTVDGPGISALEPEAVERLWSLRHAASPMIAREAGAGRVSTQFIEDSVVPPERLGAYLDGLGRILEAAGFDAIVFGHAGDANVHVNPLLDVGSADCIDRARTVLDEVAELVGALGGTLSGEHGDGRLRTPLRGRIWSDDLLDAFDRVKDRLDPAGILNPGVIRPVPGQDPFDGFVPRPRAHPG